MAVKVDDGSCIGCGSCVGTCPVEALSMNNDVAVVDEDTCIDCGACVDSCPVGALEV